MDRDPAALPLLTEKVEKIARVCRQQPNLAALTAALYGCGRRARYILTVEFTVACDGNPDILLGQQIGAGQSAFGAIDDLGATGVGILLPDGQQIFLDHTQDFFGMGQQIFQIGDALEQRLVLIFQFLAL